MKPVDQVRTDLRRLVVGQLVPLRDDELADDAPLVDAVLDSLGIAELAVFVEEEIGRPLRESEEVRSTFASLDAVVSFIVDHR